MTFNLEKEDFLTFTRIATGFGLLSRMIFYDKQEQKQPYQLTAKTLGHLDNPDTCLNLLSLKMKNLPKLKKTFLQNIITELSTSSKGYFGDKKLQKKEEIFYNYNK